MAKYRKRGEIEAVQWFPHIKINGVITSPVLEPTEDNPSGVYGQFDCDTCIPGDWIITWGNGKCTKATDEDMREYEEVNPELTSSHVLEGQTASLDVAEADVIAAVRKLRLIKLRELRKPCTHEEPIFFDDDRQWCPECGATKQRKTDWLIPTHTQHKIDSQENLF